MKKLALFALASTASALLATAAAQERPQSGYPLVGTWQWTHQPSNGTEVYEFRADGTAWVESHAERTNNTGLESINYNIFTPDRTQMLKCYEPTRSACFGPLRRIR